MVCDGTYQSSKKEVVTLSLLTGYQTGPNANKHTDGCYDDVRDSEWDGVQHRSGVHASFPSCWSISYVSAAETTTTLSWFVILSKKRVGSDSGAVALVPKCV